VGKSVLKRLVGAWYRWRVRSRAAEVGPRLLVWGSTRVSPQTVIGSHCNFNGMRIRGNGRVEIGDYFHSGDGCQIITHVHNYEGEAIPYDSTMINKDVVIEHFVWLGSNVLILGGVRIGEGAIIQAGAVVVKDIPRCGIAGGNPARVFKTRDVERFDRLKAEGRFL